jgi:[ribosomal protein S5]-alanine N-acetyltransferase
MKAVLETTHLLLRPWQEDDLDPLVRLLAKPEVARSIRLDGHVFTREETAEIHQRIVRSWNEQGLGPWAAIDKTTGSWIGKLGLMYQTDWPGPDKFEVDYELDPAWWGRRLATEGTQAALRYGFVNRALPRIIGATVPEHVASRRVKKRSISAYPFQRTGEKAPAILAGDETPAARRGIYQGFPILKSQSMRRKEKERSSISPQGDDERSAFLGEDRNHPRREGGQGMLEGRTTL